MNGSPFNMALGFVVEAIFIAIPMSCLGVVLYDISLRGMHSVFAIIAVALVSIWATFRAATLSMGKLDSWYEDRILRRKEQK
jgi:hypothetical protein